MSFLLIFGGDINWEKEVRGDRNREKCASWWMAVIIQERREYDV